MSDMNWGVRYVSRTGNSMILEGIVTTLCEDGRPNVASMGPSVDGWWTQLVLRAYKSSRTYANLKRTGQGVFHVTDDVELLARAAVKCLDRLPPLGKAKKVDGVVIADACRWYEFQVTSIDERPERAAIACGVVAEGRLRDFCGFCRAKHAVVEAAILATRLEHLAGEQIREEFQRLAVLVEKTGGDQERAAFGLLDDFVRHRLDRTRIPDT